jgi:hypothetical protein
MPLLELVRRWWRRDTASERPHAVFEPVLCRPRVPSNYQSLHIYLERRYASSVVLTFEQMEALLGGPLPVTARTQPEWWTNAAVPENLYSEAWTGAGRTATPNLMARTVTFERMT